MDVSCKIEWRYFFFQNLVISHEGVRDLLSNGIPPTLTANNGCHYQAVPAPCGETYTGVLYQSLFKEIRNVKVLVKKMAISITLTLTQNFISLSCQRIDMHCLALLSAPLLF